MEKFREIVNVPLVLVSVEEGVASFKELLKTS
jgi:hypothetical protein